MNAIKHGFVVLVLLPFFVATGVVGGAITVAGYILLGLPMLLNARLHRKYVASLPADYVDECTSEEFGAEADWVGGFLKTIVLLPLMPAIGIGETVMEQIRLAARKNIT